MLNFLLGVSLTFNVIVVFIQIVYKKAKNIYINNSLETLFKKDDELDDMLDRL